MPVRTPAGDRADEPRRPPMSSSEANALAGLYLTSSLIRALAAEGKLDRGRAKAIWSAAVADCRSDGPTDPACREACDLMERLRDLDFPA